MKLKGSESDRKRWEFFRFLGSEVDQIFRLTCGEEKVQREFVRLASYLYRYSDANGFCIYPQAISFRYVAQNMARHVNAMPDELVQRCKAWEKTYKLFLGRNLKVELYYMLKDMSETDLHESWFSDSTMESRILDWVDAGIYDPLPLRQRDSLGIVTPEFYARLRYLRQECGGWLFPEHVTNRILFVADDDLHELRWQRGSDGKYQWPTFWPSWRTQRND